MRLAHPACDLRQSGMEERGLPNERIEVFGEKRTMSTSLAVIGGPSSAGAFAPDETDRALAPAGIAVTDRR